MLKYFAILIFGSFVVTAPVSIGPISSAVQAQSSKLQKEGPTVKRARKNFEKRTTEIAKSGNLGAQRIFLNELKAELKLNLKQRSLQSDRLIDQKDKDVIADAKRRLKDLQDAFSVIAGYDAKLTRAFSPLQIEKEIALLRKRCKHKEAEILSAKLGRLVIQYKRQFEAAKLAGKQSTVSPKQAEREYKIANETNKRVQTAPVPKCKHPKNTGNVDTGGESVNLPTISGPATEPALSPAEQAAQEEQDRLERKSSWLLGDWNYKAWSGGTTNSTLRFQMEGDGTISAYLVSTTEEMQKKGFQNGMKLLRGIRDTSHQINQRGSIWSHRADVAQRFSPRDPKRKPGQIYGQPEWVNGSVIFIEKKTGELGGATGFGNRLNWHRGKLVRPDTSALDNLITEYNQRTVELDRNGTHEQRMQLVLSAIDDLLSSSISSNEADQVGTALSLLLERDELRNLPELNDALSALERSEDPTIRADAMRALAGYAAARSAVLAQTVLGNNYDSMTAAQMYRIANEGSKLHDYLKNTHGAQGDRNVSRLADAIERVKGLAAGAGNANDDIAGPLMKGISLISSPPAIRSNITAGFRFQAATVMGLLENTARGLRAGGDILSDALTGASGDRTALNRAIANSRKLEDILSAPGYAGAVFSSIKNQISNRFRFFKPMTGWFNR
ncbi:MAG: hypothetical protein ABJN65_15875 [Parasphingorhabdus sp.]